jgi:dienelactone hydrolase
MLDLARVSLLAVVSGSSSALAATAEVVHFPSKDGIEITADLYMPHKAPKTPLVVLFHQATWSRGEYQEIAPRLNQLGFNCMAVDLRSGKGVNDVVNETAAKAEQAKKKTKYLDALPDMEAALELARSKYAQGGLVIAWGSSYSAGLVVQLAGARPELADATLAFSPGEYFAGGDIPKNWVETAAKKIMKPIFITSARDEAGSWQKIFDAIPAKTKASYRPKTDGNHGSRALWKKHADSAGYWTAVESFLSTQVGVAPPAASPKQ